MTGRAAALGFALALALFAAGIEASQRGWVLAMKAPAERTNPGRADSIAIGPQASIGGDAGGIYCVTPVENGVRTHDLGGLPAGIRVVVTVEGFTQGFDPVAAVSVVSLGEKAANNVKVTNFYDNDSGGEGDARIDFVTPQAGIYLLHVGDFTDATAGCYRYHVLLG